MFNLVYPARTIPLGLGGDTIDITINRGTIWLDYLPVLKCLGTEVNSREFDSLLEVHAASLPLTVNTPTGGQRTATWVPLNVFIQWATQLHAETIHPSVRGYIYRLQSELETAVTDYINVSLDHSAEVWTELEQQDTIPTHTPAPVRPQLSLSINGEPVDPTALTIEVTTR